MTSNNSMERFFSAAKAAPKTAHFESLRAVQRNSIYSAIIQALWICKLNWQVRSRRVPNFTIPAYSSAGFLDVKKAFFTTAGDNTIIHIWAVFANAGRQWITADENEHNRRQHNAQKKRQKQSLDNDCRSGGGILPGGGESGAWAKVQVETVTKGTNGAGTGGRPGWEG